MKPGATRCKACACGNRLTISRAGAEPISDAEWESEGWEKVGEAWTCWQCLGKPMPAPLLDSIRSRELDELAAEPERSREDVLDYLDGL